MRLVKKNISREQHNALPNGLICLKGGDLATELAPFKNTSEIWNLSDFFSDEFFETKQVIYVQL